MALTYTPDAETGTSMPAFSLPTVSGENFDSSAIEGAAAKVVMFICAHCPYVQAIEDRLVTLGQELQGKDIPLVAICSNDSTDYPEDRPEALLQRSQERGYSFPYLVDATQQVAKNFGAVCTPDFFIYDRDNTLAYRGRLDDSWKDSSKVTRQELKEAAFAIAEGQKLADLGRPSMGCSIKWSEG